MQLACANAPGNACVQLALGWAVLLCIYAPNAVWDKLESYGSGAALTRWRAFPAPCTAPCLGVAGGAWGGALVSLRALLVSPRPLFHHQPNLSCCLPLGTSLQPPWVPCWQPKLLEPVFAPDCRLPSPPRCSCMGCTCSLFWALSSWRLCWWLYLACLLVRCDCALSYCVLSDAPHCCRCPAARAPRAAAGTSTRSSTRPTSYILPPPGVSGFIPTYLAYAGGPPTLEGGGGGETGVEKEGGSGDAGAGEQELWGLPRSSAPARLPDHDHPSPPHGPRLPAANGGSYVGYAAAKGGRSREGRAAAGVFPAMWWLVQLQTASSRILDANAHKAALCPCAAGATLVAAGAVVAALFVIPRMRLSTMSLAFSTAGFRWRCACSPPTG